MIDKHWYDLVKKKFKHTSSWCIWKDPNADDNNKNSNISDMNWAPKDEDSEEKFNEFFKKINTGVVFIGLNPSSEGNVKSAWESFHVGRYDYRLREALFDTDYWGSYITDLFKDVRDGNCSDVNPNDKKVEGAIEILKDELQILAKNEPIRFLVALGSKVYDKLKTYQIKHPNDKYFSHLKIVKIKHYSYRINGSNSSSKNYKDEVIDILSSSEKILQQNYSQQGYSLTEIIGRTSNNNKFAIMVNAPLMGNAEKETL